MSAVIYLFINVITIATNYERFINKLSVTTLQTWCLNKNLLQCCSFYNHIDLLLQYTVSKTRDNEKLKGIWKRLCCLLFR